LDFGVRYSLMALTFLQVYMELGSYFLFLQEQIKGIIIRLDDSSCHDVLADCGGAACCGGGAAVGELQASREASVRGCAVARIQPADEAGCISLPEQSVVVGEVGRCVGVRWRAGVCVGVLRTGPVAAGVRVYSSVSHL